MLPSKNRLSLSYTKTEFTSGKKVANGQFQIIAKKQKGIFKTAIVISKKVAAKAVDRNRIKRLVSEAIRTNLKMIKYEGVLIIIAKKNIARLKKADIEDRLLKLIARL